MRTSVLLTLLATLLGPASDPAWAAALPPGAPLDATGRLPSPNLPLAFPALRPVGTKTGLAGALLPVGTNSVMAHTAHFVPNGTTGLQLCFAGSYLSPAEGASVNSVYVAAGETVTAGGSGYTVGDTIVSAATSANRAITARVTQVTSGAVTKVNVEDGGLFIAQLPDNTAQASTSGAGTGATFSYAWTPYAYAVRAGVEPVFTGGGVAAVTSGANAIRQAVMGTPRAIGSKLYASSDILVPSGGWVCTDTIPIPAVANGAAIGLRTWMYGAGGVLVAPTGVSSRTISAMAESGTTVTATLPAGTSDLVVGRTMSITNAVPAGYNGTAYTIASIPDANTVTFTAAAGLAAVTTPGVFGTVSGSTYVSPGSNGSDLTISGTIPAVAAQQLLDLVARLFVEQRVIRMARSAADAGGFLPTQAEHLFQPRREARVIIRLTRLDPGRLRENSCSADFLNQRRGQFGGAAIIALRLADSDRSIVVKRFAIEFIQPVANARRGESLV